MRTQVLDRNRALTAALFAAALTLALIAALQAQPRLYAPSIPLMEQRIQPNVEPSAQPAAPATVAPQVAPNTTALPAPAGVPGSTTLPAAQPKVRPADGRPMGDLDPPPPSNRAWKGGFDY